MTILAASLAFALLSAQAPIQKWIVVVQDPVKGNACTIDDNKVLVVTPGKEEQCWSEVVKNHNRLMDNTEYHKSLDLAMQLIAERLGKTFKPCYNEPLLKRPHDHIGR